MDFYSEDKKCFIEPEDVVTFYKQKSNIVKWPKRLIYQPFPLPRIELNVQTENLHPLYNGISLRLLEGKILYCQGMPGAPATVILLEGLIALGVEEIIFIGLAGSIQKSIRIGELVVADTALRYEGTSYHYFPSNYLPEPCPDLFEQFTDFLSSNNVNFHQGKVCSTDAPYRETVDFVKELKKQKALAIEMEISAVYSLSSYRNVHSLATVVISDQLVDDRWTGLIKSEFSESFKLLLDTAVEFYQAH
ncbi:MAG: nucleoside phosphorylase [Candidatus Hodarchaeales archaeon]